VSGLGTNRAQNLAEWLRMATAKLCLPAQERIRLEIEAHFTESLESHQATGCSEADAQAAALAELGDATAAAKRFRRRHLTEKEAKWVGSRLNYSGPLAFLFALYAFYALSFVCFLPILKRHHASPGFPAGALLLVAALQTMGFFVLRGKIYKPDIRLYVLIQVLSLGCIILFLLWYGMGVTPVAFFMLPGPSISLVRKLRLSFKLGQVDDVWPKLPSRGAPAS
jgi:hypothetical protein